ncbi:hypothetical protein F5Y04DRAFT_251887 [Hypomontagnella monticulosa]|nr:hypothetical protein F5Y04DRAFT_251887 [Hypomontagnella monticulosa]
MLRKSAASALCVSNGSLECIARRVAGPPSRTFSSSTRQNAMLGHFTPASTPELDELLSMIRTKVILPSYLPTEQRKKIASPKYKKKLQSDPITIEIDGEVTKFQHQNPFVDIPQTRRSVMSAITKFETAEDFANLRPLLEGIAYANRKFPASFYNKIVRNVGSKGRISLIIQCARGVAKTGLKLDSSEKVMETLHFVQMHAVEANYDSAATAKALRWADMVVEMLQEKGHKPHLPKDKIKVKGELPLYRDPMTILAQLHLAAALIVRGEPQVAETNAEASAEANAEAEAEDESEGEVEATSEGEVETTSEGEIEATSEEKREVKFEPKVVAKKFAKYGRDLGRLWPKDKKLLEVQPAALFEVPSKLGYLREPNRFVSLATPLLRGLEMAVEAAETLKKPVLTENLSSRRDILASEIQEARTAAAATGKNTRCEEVWTKFYGNEA